MNKRAQEILNSEVEKFIKATDPKVAQEVFVKLISLADVLDSMGQEKDADHIDGVVKEAQSIWDFLLGGIGGAATTKSQSGESVLDALKGGHLGQFSKENLVKLITEFLVGGGIGLISAALVDKLSEHIPILKWFKDSRVIKTVVEGALSYAVLRSDFVQRLVDGLVQQVEQVFGITHQQSQQPAKPATPPPTPSQPVATTQNMAPPTPATVVQPGGESATFNIAQPVPGAAK